MSTINVSVTDPNNSGTLTIDSVSNGATVTTSTSSASSSSLSLNVVGGAGASGSSALLAAGTGIAINESNGTATISSTVTAGASNLSSLSDVSFTSPANGEVLQYNGTAWTTATVSSGGSSNLSGLSDVSISSPSSGQVLAYNGTAWAAATDNTLTLTTTAAADLGTSAAGTSSEAARADHVHDSPNLSQLADVSISSPSSGQVLAYNGTAWSTATDSALTLSSTAAENLGAASAGTSSEAARADHVHNTQNLTQLSDVDTANATSGQVLAYNGSVWIASADNAVTLSSSAPEALGTAAAGSSSEAARADHVHQNQNLAELGDVTITTQTTGQVLAYNGTAWTASTDNALTLSTTAPADHGTASAGTSSTAARADHVHDMPNITSLADVSAVAPSSGQVLAWNGSAWAPVAQSGGTGGGADLSDANAEALGTAASGTSSDAARADHVHAMPSFEDVTNGTATVTGNLALDPSTGVTILQGGTAGSAALVLNCEANSHGVTIQSPAHSLAATYTLTLPDTAGTADQVLQTDGAGALSWRTISSSGISWVSAPGSSASSGQAGQVAYDADGYFYLHNGAQWLRAQLQAFSSSAGVTITQHPQSVGVDVFDDVDFVVVFTTFGVTDVSIVWQRSTNSGSTWTTISGETSATLTISGATESDSGQQYRAILTPSAAPASAVTTNAATLTVASIDYLLDETGNRLAAENDDLLVTEGSATTGGGGGGGSTTTGDDFGLVERLTGTAAGEQFGRARIQLDKDGDRVLIFDNQFSTFNAYGALTTGPWNANTRWKIQNRSGGFTTEVTSDAQAWLPNSVTMAGDEDVVVGLWLESSRAYQLKTWEKYVGSWRALTSATINYGNKGAAGPITSSNNYGNFDRWGYRARTALSDDGEHLVVSLPGYLTTETDKIFIYDWNSSYSSWTQRTVLDLPNDSDPNNNDGFHSGTQLLQISNDGNAIIISDGGIDAHSKIIRWDYNGTTWTRSAIKPGGSGATQNGFAMAASKDCNRVVTGFDQYWRGQSTYQGRGLVQVHDYNTSTDSWTSTTIIDAATGSGAYDYNGWDVVISDDGSRIAYSLPGYDDATGALTVSNAGAVRIMELVNGTWTQVGDLIRGTTSNQRIGRNMAMSSDGSTLAVASVFHQTATAANVGKVEFFEDGVIGPPASVAFDIPNGVGTLNLYDRTTNGTNICAANILVDWPNSNDFQNYSISLEGDGAHEGSGDTADGTSTITGQFRYGNATSAQSGNLVGNNDASWRVVVQSTPISGSYGTYNVATTHSSAGSLDNTTLTVRTWNDNSNHGQITWNAPTQNADLVTGYVVQAQLQSSTPGSWFNLGTTTTTSYTITNINALTADSAYKFRVYAVGSEDGQTISGTSVESSEITYRPYATVSTLSGFSVEYCDQGGS